MTSPRLIPHNAGIIPDALTLIPPAIAPKSGLATADISKTFIPGPICDSFTGARTPSRPSWVWPNGSIVQSATACLMARGGFLQGRRWSRWVCDQREKAVAVRERGEGFLGEGEFIHGDHPGSADSQFCLTHLLDDDDGIWRTLGAGPVGPWSFASGGSWLLLSCTGESAVYHKVECILRWDVPICLHAGLFLRSRFRCHAT